ncbi:Planctomycete cytochrome C [Rosistilla carotiformis]|uniref:Planctomycete cytochrome C n=1 Tax=Rosistilla carotiformis TaxID=2528017 RepID=A0A518JQR6_9BACT|nr:c-type cytochrome domain-containing protein [Rosistilla carotiformis]QDV67879.1 Planctomycete cytochrome C [Rosistilla carotiformis]
MKNKTLSGIVLCLAILSNQPIFAAGPLNDDGQVIDFARDVAPILRTKCLSCHGPDDAKNDFRVDDPEIMADYIEAGDHESSSLYIDYIVAEDPDMLMPPESEGPMSPGEIAILRLWIEEGANWPEDAKVVLADPNAVDVVIVEPVPVPSSLASRVWAFQGYLHPATVHFPVALLTFGAIFVVLGYKWPQLAHPIPFACLLCGALSAIAASAMGWSFADQEGYGSWSKGLEASISRHRWTGVGVTITSVAFALIAIKAEMNENLRLRKVWQIGLLISAGMVGLVGHIGGELTYGEEFYHKAFEILSGTNSELPVIEIETVSTDGES